VPLLQMREVTFEARGERVGPFSVTLDAGQHHAATFTNANAAAIVALLAAGLAKATSGQVFVDEFDPRVQPVHVKRIVGYVPHDAVHHEFRNFARYIDYRATLWGIPRDRATVRAYALLERLEGVHEAFAYPLIGALLSSPKLLVLDRPQAAYAQHILDVAGADTAVFSTHTSIRAAQTFQRTTAHNPAPVYHP
jgi:ABC-type multidrug transport system ATPase subunit